MGGRREEELEVRGGGRSRKWEAEEEEDNKQEVYTEDTMGNNEGTWS